MGVDAIPKILDPLPGGKSLVNAVDFVANWARANSLWPLVYGTSCCAIEMMATGSSKHDWSRFGWEVVRATPRQADMIILAGTLVEKMVEPLLTLYEQMPAPKYVVAMGSCTVSGGPFYYDNYSVVKGADRILPVDVYIPGCPPRPEALLQGIMHLQDVIRQESIRDIKEKPIKTERPVNTFADDKAKWEAKEKERFEATQAERDKFKEENPDYKAYKHKKVAKEKFEAVERAVITPPGKSKSELFKLIVEKFPSVTLHEKEETNLEVVEELGLEEELDLVVQPEQYLSLVNFLKNNNDLGMDLMLELTAVDWEDHFDVVVHLMSTEQGHKVFIRVPLPHEDHPEIETLSEIYKTANWHEREVYDLFGIIFTGHPDLRRIFLIENFPGHPLRKDFVDENRIIKKSY